MKTIIQDFVFVLLMFCLLMSSSALAMTGGDYEISWSTIDGGGGRSTGGDYALVGTVGQPDAGDMAGGDFELSGGFWPGGPILSCFVNFEHFSAFARYWMDIDCDAGNDWCFGSDLDWSTEVDIYDVGELVYWWLDTCPVDWPWQ